MLARSMFKVYVPRAERKALYKRKLPGIMARLQAAELIAKKIKLVRGDVFSVTSGFFVMEYRRNMAMMKLISHALFKLEKEGWIKVCPTRIYYIEKKKDPVTGLEEKHSIFNIIAETVREIATTFEGSFAKRRADEIRNRCASLFHRVENLTKADNIEKARKKVVGERYDWSPLTRAAAKDIAAGGYFYAENKKVFEKRAEDYVIKTGNKKLDEPLLQEAQEFDQYIDTHIQRAKELSGRELRLEFSLGLADRSTFFPGKKEFDSLNKTTDLSKSYESQPYDITYIISDLHFQDYVHRDIYELLRLIHVVVSTGGTLIINGDFIDSWRAKKLFMIIKENKIFFDALRKVKRVVIIKGNHDGWLGFYKNMKVFSENVSVVDRVYIDGLHIEHANDYDRLNSEASRIGKTATQLVKGIERNEVIGPQLLAWVEYAGKRFMSKKLWTEQKELRVFEGVKDVYKRRDPEGNIYSREKPLNIVFGHFHFPGLFKAYGKINGRVVRDPVLSGKARLFITDSWYNSEGYAGQVTVFAKKKEASTGQLLATTFLWEYIDAKRILTLYGAWEF